MTWPAHLHFARPPDGDTCGFPYCGHPALTGRYVCAACAAKLDRRADEIRADGGSKQSNGGKSR